MFMMREDTARHRMPRRHLMVSLLMLGSILLPVQGVGKEVNLKLQHWPGGVKNPVSIEWEGKRRGEGIKDTVRLSFTYREGALRKKKYYTFCKGKDGKVQLGFVNGGRKDTGIEIPVYHCIDANSCSLVNGGVRIKILGNPKSIGDISKNARVEYIYDNVIKPKNPKVKFVVLSKNGRYYPAVIVHGAGERVDYSYYKVGYFYSKYNAETVCDFPNRQVASAHADQDTEAADEASSSARLQIVLVDEKGEIVKRGRLNVTRGACTSAPLGRYARNRDGQWAFSASELPKQGRICVAYKAPELAQPTCITWIKPAGVNILTLPKPASKCPDELKFTIQVGGQALHQAELGLLAQKLSKLSDVVFHVNGYLSAKASKGQVKSWLQPYFTGLRDCRMQSGLCVFKASGRRYVRSVRLKLRRAGTDVFTADCLPRLRLGNTDCGRMELGDDYRSYRLDLPNDRCNQLIFDQSDVQQVRITFDKPDENTPGARQCQLKTGKLTLAHLQGKMPLDVKVIQPRRQRWCVLHIPEARPQAPLSQRMLLHATHVMFQEELEYLANSGEFGRVRISSYIWEAPRWRSFDDAEDLSGKLLRLHTLADMLDPDDYPDNIPPQMRKRKCDIVYGVASLYGQSPPPQEARKKLEGLASIILKNFQHILFVSISGGVTKLVSRKKRKGIKWHFPPGKVSHAELHEAFQDFLKTIADKRR